MKNLIKQFYTEGFGTTFYLKPIKFVKRKEKNKTLVKILSLLIKIFYTTIFIAIGAYILYNKLK